MQLLRELGFKWGLIDANLCAAVRFKKLGNGAPSIVALLGGASSGKSTLFNSLLGREVSRISVHAHETLGPIAAVHASKATSVQAWLDDGLLLSHLETERLPNDDCTTGRVGAAFLVQHERPGLENVLLLDTPDITSKLAVDEGAITLSLLPWCDGLIVVVDEERWFDAAVFEDAVEPARDFGPQLWVVFNRTEQAERLEPADEQRLAAHAAAFHAGDHCLSPFRPGVGYRPFSDETQKTVLKWFARSRPDERNRQLRSSLQRRCATIVSDNVTRAEQYNRLVRDVDNQLAGVVETTSLSTDLLTAEERDLLGIGHRFLPLYDVIRTVRQRLVSFGRLRPAAAEVDFEKRTDELADVLRRNLEHRFHRAADRIDATVADSRYLADAGANWKGNWATPPFDEREWARRIRAHIDAWKEETSKLARHGDLASIGIATPLLVADLLFLGGAGITLTWAAAWVAGFFGGKGLVNLVKRSTAFEEYQTTVRAYQSLIREALAEQWEQNLKLIPRRHMRMTDPVLESIMYWSTPQRAGI